MCCCELIQIPYPEFTQNSILCNVCFKPWHVTTSNQKVACIWGHWTLCCHRSSERDEQKVGGCSLRHRSWWSVRAASQVALWGLCPASLLEVTWKGSELVINDLYKHYSQDRKFELQNLVTWRVKMLSTTSVSTGTKIRAFGTISLHWTQRSVHFIPFFFFFLILR